MRRLLDPATARRRFAGVTFLFWLPVGLYLPSQVLLLTERGLGLAVVAGLYAVYSVTVSVMELPTGGLSDVVGRRAVLAAAGLVNVCALILLVLGTTLWALTAAMLLMGLGRALSSGPAEAWYVDTVQAHSGDGADLRDGLARGGTACAVALAAGTLAGGALPLLLDTGNGSGTGLGDRLARATDGLVLPLSVPGLLGAAVGVGHVVYVLTALPEPPRPPRTPASARSVLSGVPATIVAGLRLGVRQSLVRRVLLTAAAAGAALATIELLAPVRSARLTGAPESGAVLFAALACGGFLCTAAGSHGAPLVARLTGGSAPAALAGLAVSGAGLLLLGVTAAFDGTPPAVLAAGGYALVYLGLGAAGPNENDLLHRAVGSATRATALSAQSLALQSAGALAGLVAGLLPAGPLPWLPGALALLAGAALWAVRVRPRPAAPAGAGHPPPAPRSAGEVLPGTDTATR
ncbi:MFS transporter [Streptomyces lavendofoliae]|uniref:MFS transporter n=1 Tax=Streptomyces lavendofoliae TaxID=67314 RepID=UPI00300F248F